MNILITICARGGSKGVKNKNIRLLNGKPLMAYTVTVAKKWGNNADVVCSTDSEEIKKVAEKYGAKVPFMRPNELATDTSGKVPVIRHALIESEKIYNKKYDLVVDLDVTSPIRTVKDMDSCLVMYNSGNYEIVISAVLARKNPYFNMLELNEKGYAMLSKTPGKKILRRQDAPKVYSANASIYFYDREFLIKEDNNSVMTSKKVGLYVMHESSSVDIDSEIDFKFIEFLIKEKVVSI